MYVYVYLCVLAFVYVCVREYSSIGKEHDNMNNLVKMIASKYINNAESVYLGVWLEECKNCCVKNGA